MADLTKREIIVTEDGSHSVMVHEINESFHSDRGSWQESLHTYIDCGLMTYLKEHPDVASVKVFEMGFGTGLNALQTLMKAEELQLPIEFHTIEAYPLLPQEFEKLNFSQFDEKLQEESTQLLHKAPWEELEGISDYFSLLKLKGALESTFLPGEYQVVYYDAFSPKSQPELWLPEIFEKIYSAMSYGGVLVSYSAAGLFKRSLQAAGFWLEEIRGAKGKREMVRALKM